THTYTQTHTHTHIHTQLYARTCCIDINLVCSYSLGIWHLQPTHFTSIPSHYIDRPHVFSNNLYKVTTTTSFLFIFVTLPTSLSLYIPLSFCALSLSLSLSLSSVHPFMPLLGSVALPW